MMRTNSPAITLVTAAALGLFGCIDSPGAELIAPPHASEMSAVSVPQVTRTAVAVDHVVFLPCTAEFVQLSGNLQIEILSRALDSDEYQVRFAIQSTGVTGHAQVGDGAYRVEGAANGVLTTSHRDRAVSRADFRLIVTSPPDVEVGRARVPARFGVQVAFPVSQAGILQEPLLDEVLVSKGCEVP